MKNIVGKGWRDSASLIVLAKRNSEVLSRSNDASCVNYDILLQTRSRSASFPGSVVFPGGVSEPVDGGEPWLKLLKSFGYTQNDFETLHQPHSVVTPIFRNNPVLRHVALRITAIRETFEELGLLICSRDHKEHRSGIWASVISDIDVKYWQKKLSKDPGELISLCKEHNCYPDIWSLHYWSNWLTPATFQKRFDTAFFVTAFASRPQGLNASNEVTNIQWSSPLEVLNKPDVILLPPQVYELKRLSHVPDVDELIRFAKERSRHTDVLHYPVSLKTKDGILHALPGDDLYPLSVDYNKSRADPCDRTLYELRENCQTLHRVEQSKGDTPRIIFKNYKPVNHIDMGDLNFKTRETNQ